MPKTSNLMTRLTCLWPVRYLSAMGPDLGLGFSTGNKEERINGFYDLGYRLAAYTWLPLLSLCCGIPLSAVWVCRPAGTALFCIPSGDAPCFASELKIDFILPDGQDLWGGVKWNACASPEIPRVSMV